MKSRLRVTPALPYAVFILLALASWKRWIEPYVDSGRELMVPWRIEQGEALYRDVRFYYGPLGPYLAAAVEAAFGRSLDGRVLLAAAVALLHLEGLRRLARRFLAESWAALASSLAVAVAFFLRPGGCHLFPYSLDTSLAVAALTWALHLAAGSGLPQRAGRAAGFLAAACLSRPELALATITALAIEKGQRKRLLLLAFVPLATAGAIYTLLSLGTPLATLRQEGWLAFASLPSEFGKVYSSFAGLDQPGLRLAELALAVLVLALFAVFLLAAAFLGGRLRARSCSSGLAVEVAAVALLVTVALVRFRPPEKLAPRLELIPPLVRVVPILLLAAALWRLYERLAGHPPQGLLREVPDAVLLVSGFFSARLLLAAGYVGPYNAFFMPLPIVLCAVAVKTAADRAASAAASPALPRLVAGALGVLLLYRIAVLAHSFRHPAWSRVETAAGSLFIPEPVSSATRLALGELASRVPSEGTIVGFPEVGFLNYALGRRNPLPQDQFFPGHLDRSAEQRAARQLRSEPPDAFVYVNVLTVGHGAVAFGKDYLVELDRSVRSLSEPVASFGPGARDQARVGDPDFFIEIRARRGAGRP